MPHAAPPTILPGSYGEGEGGDVATDLAGLLDILSRGDLSDPVIF